MARGELRLELVEARELAAAELANTSAAAYYRVRVEEPTSRQFKRSRNHPLRESSFAWNEVVELSGVSAGAKVVIDIWATPMGATPTRPATGRGAAAGEQQPAEDEFLGKAKFVLSEGAERDEWVELLAGRVRFRLTFVEGDEEEGGEEEAPLAAADAAARKPPASLGPSGSAGTTSAAPQHQRSPPSADGMGRRLPFMGSSGPRPEQPRAAQAASGLESSARGYDPTAATTAARAAYDQTTFENVVRALADSADWEDEVEATIARDARTLGSARARGIAADLALSDAYEEFRNASEAALHSALEEAEADTETFLVRLQRSQEEGVPQALEDTRAERVLRLLWCMDDESQYTKFVESEAHKYSEHSETRGVADGVGDDTASPPNLDGGRADDMRGRGFGQMPGGADNGIDAAMQRDMLNLGLAAMFGMAAGDGGDDDDDDDDGDLRESSSPSGARDGSRLTPPKSPLPGGGSPREGRVIGDRFEELEALDVDALSPDLPTPVTTDRRGSQDGVLLRPPARPSRQPPSVEALLPGFGTDDTTAAENAQGPPSASPSAGPAGLSGDLLLADSMAGPDADGRPLQAGRDSAAAAGAVARADVDVEAEGSGDEGGDGVEELRAHEADDDEGYGDDAYEDDCEDDVAQSGLATPAETLEESLAEESLTGSGVSRQGSAGAAGRPASGGGGVVATGDLLGGGPDAFGSAGAFGDAANASGPVAAGETEIGDRSPGSGGGGSTEDGDALGLGLSSLAGIPAPTRQAAPVPSTAAHDLAAQLDDALLSGVGDAGVLGTGDDVATGEGNEDDDLDGGAEEEEEDDPELRDRPPPVEERTVFRNHANEMLTRFAGEIKGASVELDNLYNCDILLMDVSSQVTVDKCKNCRLLIGPTNGSVFMRDCVSCMVSVACRQLRTRACEHCDIFVHTLGPIVETSTQMQFERWNCWYPGLTAQFAQANLDPSVNKWGEVYDFNADDDSIRRPHWNHMPPNQFIRWQINFLQGPGTERMGVSEPENPVELPNEYLGDEVEFEETEVEPPAQARYSERVAIGKRLVDGKWVLVYDDESMSAPAQPTSASGAQSSGRRASQEAERSLALSAAQRKYETQLQSLARHPGWKGAVDDFVREHAAEFLPGESDADRAQKHRLHDLYAATVEEQLEESLSELAIDSEAFMRDKAVNSRPATPTFADDAENAMLQVRAIEDFDAFCKLMQQRGGSESEAADGQHVPVGRLI